MKAETSAVHIYEIVDILHGDVGTATPPGHLALSADQALQGFNEHLGQGRGLSVPVRHLERYVLSRYCLILLITLTTQLSR